MDHTSARTLLRLLRATKKNTRNTLIDGDDCDLCKAENLHYWIEAFGEEEGPIKRNEWCEALQCPIGA